VTRPGLQDRVFFLVVLVFSGPDAVLVAGSGLIIRLRKDTVGSTPTRPTIYLKGLQRCKPFLLSTKITPFLQSLAIPRLTPCAWLAHIRLVVGAPTPPATTNYAAYAGCK
jgi:hypothetical protein